MERHPIVRPLFTALLALGLVFALAACGSALDAAIVEDGQGEAIVDLPDGAPTVPGEGSTTYDQPPTIDGVPVTEGDLEDGLPDGAVLEGDFSGWDFGGLHFKNVSLNGAKFDGAGFVGTKFSGSTLHHGSFVGADFTGASFMGADLSYGNFSTATFTNASMPGGSFARHQAIFDGATWTDGVRICAVPSIGDCN
jgi:uncharacterized protein YjbI with pentapeptide repeats